MHDAPSSHHKRLPRPVRDRLFRAATLYLCLSGLPTRERVAQHATSVVRAGRYLVVLGVTMGLVAAGCGSSGQTMTGSTLLARVRSVYRHVPAVHMVTSGTPHQEGHWTFVLRRGIITAERFVERGPHQSVFVYGYPNGRAYNFLPTARCWIVNRYGWTGEGRGERFPDVALRPGVTARRVGNEWRLPIVSSSGYGDTLLIDAKTLLVKTRLFGGYSYAEHYKTLTRAPTIPKPRPLCRK